MSSDHQHRWLCAQIGAREHYAIPRALHQMGRLATLYTDFWADSITRKMTRLPALRSLSSRYNPGLGRASVRSYNIRSLAWEAKLRQMSRSNERYLGYDEIGRRFASAVRQDLKHRRDLSPEMVFFAYDTGVLEVFEYLESIGIPRVVCQIDPSRVEAQVVAEEAKLWPGWQNSASPIPEAYFKRREQEWALANRIMVNSPFCRQALIQQGVSSEKLVVIPLCYEPGDIGPKIERPRSDSHRAPLRILFLGQVILRKGIQYLIEAAKLLRNATVHFDVVGPIGITDEAVKSAPSNVTFHGRVNRDEATAWYRQADVFVLPTLSDGFALTQLEAMANGLPVITTSRCGEVVTDGLDGFIVPARDPEILAQTITRYLEDRGFLRLHQEAARQKAGQFTMSHLAENLVALETELYNRPAGV